MESGREGTGRKRSGDGKGRVRVSKSEGRMSVCLSTVVTHTHTNTHVFISHVTRDERVLSSFLGIYRLFDTPMCRLVHLSQK